MKIDFNALVMLDHGVPVTTSFRVAEIFKKQHKNVLQAVQKLECSENFTKLNFKLCYKINELQNGKPQPYYEMTKDGFVFLVMGFTGKEAAQFKEAYINAFNWIQDELMKRGMSLMQRYNFVSLKFNTRKDEVSNSARSMRFWQDEKPEFLGELEILEKELQPHLTGLELKQ
ncbi:Rha family transcriptional regulator [Acinetobacter sp. Ac_3412]|nr:Rha family transcriptional regulator [Acinetobacter sp. Ac_3412]NNP75562.1 Rha family transcriptional regulator [Acinetobacter sp. Ac_3412]